LIVPENKVEKIEKIYLKIEVFIKIIEEFYVLLLLIVCLITICSEFYGDHTSYLSVIGPLT